MIFVFLAEEASISIKPKTTNNQIEVCNSDGEESSESDDDVEDTKTGELPTDIRYCIVCIMTILDWF